MTSDVLPALFALPGGQSLRGLAAGRELKPGEAAITVPKQMLISYDYVMASDLVRPSGQVQGQRIRVLCECCERLHGLPATFEG